MESRIPKSNTTTVSGFFITSVVSSSCSIVIVSFSVSASALPLSLEALHAVPKAIHMSNITNIIFLYINNQPSFFKSKHKCVCYLYYENRYQYCKFLSNRTDQSQRTEVIV